MDGHFSGSNVYVWKETFAIIRAKKPIEGALALVQDGNEIMAIVDQSKLNENDAIEMKRFWRAFTLEIVSPFETIGFLGLLGNAMAEEGISVCVVPGYSCDYVLVEQGDFEKAAAKFRKLGCNLKVKTVVSP